MPEVQRIKLADLDLKRSFQARVKGLDKSHVEEMREAYANKVELPRPVAWRMPDGSYRLAEGFHRVEGAMQAGVKSLNFTVLAGSESEYRIHAACSNQGHGLKRTNADKRHAVEVLLKELPNESDRSIAERAGVSHTFVAEMRPKTDEEKDDIQTPALATVATPKIENVEKQGVSENQVPKNCESDDHEKPTQKAPENTPEPVSQPEPADKDSGTGVQTEFIKQVEAVCRELDRLKATVEGWKEHKEAYAIHFPTIVEGIARIRTDLWGSRLSHDCPYCEKKPADDCKACRGTRKVIKFVHTQGARSMNRYGGVA